MQGSKRSGPEDGLDDFLSGITKLLPDSLQRKAAAGPDGRESDGEGEQSGSGDGSELSDPFEFGDSGDESEAESDEGLDESSVGEGDARFSDDDIMGSGDDVMDDVGQRGDDSSDEGLEGSDSEGLEEGDDSDGFEGLGLGGDSSSGDLGESEETGGSEDLGDSSSDSDAEQQLRKQQRKTAAAAAGDDSGRGGEDVSTEQRSQPAAAAAAPSAAKYVAPALRRAQAAAAAAAAGGGSGDAGSSLPVAVQRRITGLLNRWVSVRWPSSLSMIILLINFTKCHNFIIVVLLCYHFTSSIIVPAAIKLPSCHTVHHPINPVTSPLVQTQPPTTGVQCSVCNELRGQQHHPHQQVSCVLTVHVQHRLCCGVCCAHRLAEANLQGIVRDIIGLYETEGRRAVAEAVSEGEHSLSFLRGGVTWVGGSYWLGTRTGKAAGRHSRSGLHCCGVALAHTVCMPQQARSGAHCCGVVSSHLLCACRNVFNNNMWLRQCRKVSSLPRLLQYCSGGSVSIGVLALNI